MELNKAEMSSIRNNDDLYEIRETNNLSIEEVNIITSLMKKQKML